MRKPLAIALAGGATLALVGGASAATASTIPSGGSAPASSPVAVSASAAASQAKLSLAVRHPDAAFFRIDGQAASSQFARAYVGGVEIASQYLQPGFVFYVPVSFLATDVTVTIGSYDTVEASEVFHLGEVAPTSIPEVSDASVVARSVSSTKIVVKGLPGLSVSVAPLGGEVIATSTADASGLSTITVPVGANRAFLDVRQSYNDVESDSYFVVVDPFTGVTR